MTILKWALIFLVVSIIAGLLGFTGAVSSLAFGIAERLAVFWWQVFRHGRLVT